MKKLMFVFSAFLCMLFCPMTGATETKASETSVAAKQDYYRVTLRIIDGNTNEPIIGATVQVKGTNNAVVTDFDGYATIDVSDLDSILVISFVGFKPVEVSVADLFKPSAIYQNNDIYLYE